MAGKSACTFSHTYISVYKIYYTVHWHASACIYTHYMHLLALRFIVGIYIYFFILIYIISKVDLFSNKFLNLWIITYQI